MRTPFSLSIVLYLFTMSALGEVPEHAQTQCLESIPGFDQCTAQLTQPGQGRGSHAVLDDGTPGSVYYTIGTTWYDFQTYGTAGKQIAVDHLGKVHFVWTQSTDMASSSRHVAYNYWDPESESMQLGDEGVQVDGVARAGYVTVAVDQNGFAYPAFQQAIDVMGTSRAAAAIDFLPATGAFNTFEVPWDPGSGGVYWVKDDVDINGDIHAVGSEFFGSLDYYMRGTPVFNAGVGESIDWGDGFHEWDPATSSSMDVAASRLSQRVAVAWIQDAPGVFDGENVYLKVSEDGGENWSETINVTGCAPIDTMCVDQGGDLAECNGDTIRPWLDLSLIFDDQDNVHIAFSGRGWFYWDEEDGSVGPLDLVYSSIWHWGEDRQEYNIIADAWYSHTTVGLGTNNLMCHRPSLGIDTTTGFLYCSYQQFDSTQVSAQGYPSGDAWVSVSADNGRTWSASTNVTDTDGGVDTPVGDCMNERDISIAKYIADGKVHMIYLFDINNGTGATHNPEGDPTLNDMIYQQIPVEDIPTRPLMNPYRAFRADSTGYPWGLDTTLAVTDRPSLTPSDFTLYQNYPNPFNPSTSIQFDLGTSSAVSLTIYDISGREASRLLDHARLNAGAHVVNFDASALASGVYFYRLESGSHNSVKKMMLIK